MLYITWKGLWARKRRLGGAVIAIVLGVAFLAGALALGDTLSSNFDRIFTSANAGTDAVVRSATKVGNGIRAQRPLVPASLAASIARTPGVADAQPQVVGYGELLGKNGRVVGGNGPPRLAGNWIGDPALNAYHLVAGHPPAGANEVVINRGAADDGGLQVGDTTTVLLPAPVRVRVAGIATFGTVAGLGKATFVAFTLPDAERYITGRPGQVSSILVKAAPGVGQAELVSRLQPHLPTGVEALTGAAIVQQNINDLSGAFLTAMRAILVVFAAIALLVATFSIANTFSILVAQRTREEALLRTIGASRRQVLASVAVETLAVGAVASVLGLVGGIGIAGLLKGLFDAAGFALPAGGLVITAGTVITAVVTGIVVTMLAGLAPAMRAARVAPLQALRDVAAQRVDVSRTRMVVGLALTIVGVALVVVALRGSPHGILGRAGIGILLTTAGVVIVLPAIARRATGVLGAPVARTRSITGTLARDNVMRNPRRSAAAATALTIGVAIVTLFTVFASSLRTSITNDVDRSFVGDAAITAPGFGGGLSPQLATAVARLPEVAVATGLATGQVRIGSSSPQITAVDPKRIGAVLDLHPTAGSIGSLTPGSIAVSKHQADADQLTIGSLLVVTLPDGAVARQHVGAIYSSRSLVGDYVLPIALWSAHADQTIDSTILVKVADGGDTHSAMRAVESVAASFGKPTVQDRSAFVASTGRIINAVLTIVYVLLALAVLIALFGIANTLSLSINERVREIGLLRAVGQTRRQLRSTIRLESVIVSLFGTLAGLVLGTFLGWALSTAADKAQSIATFTFPATRIAVIVIVGGIAGVLAGSRPSRRAARLDILDAINHE
jgi:putative ABC transport system permease protein